MNQAAPAAELPRTVPDLMAAAAALAGLDDFGDLHFMKGLSVLIDGFGNEARLSAIGEQLAYGGVLNMLVNKLRYVRDTKAHPEILDEPIARPIIILGLPRTGTTLVERLLTRNRDVRPSEENYDFTLAFSSVINEHLAANPGRGLSPLGAALEVDGGRCI